MSFLTWEDSKCANPPEGWQAFVREQGEAWSWTAEFAGDCLTRFGMGSEAAAQQACEAALLRLGALPLPVWQPVQDGVWSIGSGLWDARVYEHGDCHHLRKDSPSWSVAEGCFVRARGTQLAVPECKRMAANVFRALLADSLEQARL